jgi:ribosomal protein L12E/L44/L45/RPP1/RPP2
MILAALLAAAAGAATPEAVTNVFESATVPIAENRLDKLVFDGLAKLNIQPVLCSDAVFVRRAFLDVIGTLPTADEAR